MLDNKEDTWVHLVVGQFENNEIFSNEQTEICLQIPTGRNLLLVSGCFLDGLCITSLFGQWDAYFISIITFRH